MLAGFWTFAYNILRTLATLDEYDVTERHFAYALGFFCLLTLFGVVLAVDFTYPLTQSLPVSHGNLKGAHATIAIFGAVLTTIYGALYQLGTMFTQTELNGVDEYLQSLEAAAHPLGVVLLAGGRLIDAVLVAQLGGLLVVGAALALSAVLGRRLYEMRVEWEPMHTRYAIVAVALAAWRSRPPSRGRRPRQPICICSVRAGRATCSLLTLSVWYLSGRCTTSYRSSSGSTDTAITSDSRRCR